jgi:hypothetical protein
MQDDRKKTIVLGALFVVIIAVGAFQLRPSGATPPPAKATPSAVAQAAQTQAQAQEQTKEAAATASAELPPLPARDPFAAPDKAPATTPTPPAAPGPQIHPMSGMIPPMGIPGAQLVKDQGLPLAGTSAGAPAPKIESTMTWRLTGVVTGAHPLAVLADATGNQRLIRVGSAIDPDSELTSVSKNSATIVFRGKTLHLFVSGDPNAK